MKRVYLLLLGIGAATAALVAAMTSGELPKWVRIMLVAGALLFATGAGLYGYRYYNQPVTLTLAAGSIDGDAVNILSALGAKIASSNGPVRLKILDTVNAVGAEKALASGKADLAVLRGDISNTTNARTIVRLTYGVTLLISPDGKITDIDGLKGKTVGVIGGPVNQRVVDALTREYDLKQKKVTFTDLAPADALQAIQSKKVQAILVVMPITERYLGMLRKLLPSGTKQNPALIAIDSAGAIAEISKYFESFDLPKGSLRGSPAIPDDDLTTLRVPFYLVARKNLDDDTAGMLAKEIMENRRALIGEFPVMAQIAAPETDKDAYIQIHPGAAAYYDGDTKTFFDKYGDQFYYGSMVFGVLMSVLAGVWKFMGLGPNVPEKRPLNRLYAFTARIREAQCEEDLFEIENKIDEILKDELQRYGQGEADPGEVAALGLATHRLEYLVMQQRHILASKARPAAKPARA